MARKQRFREDDDAAIDMTPMLDIVFIMLIFFIVTTSFVKEAGIEVVKPKAAAAQQNSKGNIFIAIKANGEVWMDKRAVDTERVAANIERMLAEQPTESIIVQAHKDAKHGVVVKVMDAIKSAGDLKIVIAAEKK